jgi:hypothetical protein
MGHEEGREGRGRAGAHGQASSSPDKGLDPMDGPPSMCYSATRAGPGPAQLFTRAVGPGVPPPQRERERESRAGRHGSQVMARLKKIARRIITAPSSTVVIL